jgi:hypothetical protein
MNQATIKKGKYPSGTNYWKVQAFVGSERIRRFFSPKFLLKMGKFSG